MWYFIKPTLGCVLLVALAGCLEAQESRPELTLILGGILLAGIIFTLIFAFKKE